MPWITYLGIPLMFFLELYNKDRVSGKEHRPFLEALASLPIKTINLGNIDHLSTTQQLAIFPTTLDRIVDAFTQRPRQRATDDIVVTLRRFLLYWINVSRLLGACVSCWCCLFNDNNR